jgi:hypothetical protein
MGSKHILLHPCAVPALQDAISVIETDCEVDFAPPLDYVEPTREEPRAATAAPAAAAAPAGDGRPASGEEVRPAFRVQRAVTHIAFFRADSRFCTGALAPGIECGRPMPALAAASGARLPCRSALLLSDTETVCVASPGRG